MNGFNVLTATVNKIRTEQTEKTRKKNGTTLAHSHTRSR